MYIRKSEHKGYCGNYCSLRPGSWQKQTTKETMRCIKVKVKIMEISKKKFSVISQPMSVKFI